jgi:D-tagatose-1,6-bisphosphate aldolase subunit GatZ/KbaZ
MSHILQRLSTAFSDGIPLGLYSVCSAHPLVLRAAMRQALADDAPLLVEATCNQVNQFGGYTGMRPADFRDVVLGLAEREGYTKEKVIFGGDHLGPNPWSHLPAEQAMVLAEEMVAEYSRAGFAKMHLDASMACLREQNPLPDSVVADRAARLCLAAERNSNGDSRYYVIGTEVPIPGGATESLEELEVTSCDHAAHTLETHRKIFAKSGLLDVWPRVIALVVQPGVEFNHDSVVDYSSRKTVGLQKLLRDIGGLVFEAHSTDYQKPTAYRELVHDGFAILKVGPGLTFALREVLFGLEKIEQELFACEQCSRLAEVMEQEMLSHPEHWAKHYHGTTAQQKTLRRYSYSDRIRYYWGVPVVQTAVDTLMRNLNSVEIPETLVSAMLPQQYHAIREQALRPTPEEIAVFAVQQALQPYAAAVAAR